MISILHGENLVESRKVLVSAMKKARQEGMEVISLVGNKTNLAQARNTLQSDSLLGKNRLLIIENLFSSQKTNEKQKIIDFLGKEKFDNDLIIWEEKEIKSLALLPKAEVKIFKIKQSLFQFLESLKPGNSRQMLEFLGQVKNQEEPEMIFYMLIRQIRYLILAKDRLLTLPDWQRRKFEIQAGYFSQDKLKQIYQQLLEIDYAQKTSGDPYLLASRLDLLIAGL